MSILPDVPEAARSILAPYIKALEDISIVSAGSLELLAFHYSDNLANTISMSTQVEKDLDKTITITSQRRTATTKSHNFKERRPSDFLQYEGMRQELNWRRQKEMVDLLKMVVPEQQAKLVVEEFATAVTASYQNRL